jgi:hypothetical protein
MTAQLRLPLEPDPPAQDWPAPDDWLEIDIRPFVDRPDPLEVIGGYVVNPVRKARIDGLIRFMCFMVPALGALLVLAFAAFFALVFRDAAS